MQEYSTTDELVRFAVESAMGQGCVSRGDMVLVLAGASVRPGSAVPDVLRIVQVG
jgi:hypothetical protein